MSQSQQLLGESTEGGGHDPDELHDENADLRAKVRELEKALKKAEGKAKHRKNQLIRIKGKASEWWQKSEEEKEQIAEQKQHAKEVREKEGLYNITFGFAITALLAVIHVAALWDVLHAGDFKGWATAALTVFGLFLASAFIISIFLCLMKMKFCDPDDIPGGEVCFFCGLIVASALALAQFQFYLGLLAWGYPYVVEPKALTKVDWAYNASFLQTSMDEIAADMDWTFERKLVEWDTAVKHWTSRDDFISPRPEHVGLLAHLIPLVAALIYQFGVGSYLDVKGMSGVVLDFVDVQDFYLLLIENDIVVSYWSRPQDGGLFSNVGMGQNVSFGKVDVALDNGEIYTYSSTMKKYEDWQIKAELTSPTTWLYRLLMGFDPHGAYYNYSMWWYIMMHYIFASIYVALWPWVSVVLHTCFGADDEAMMDVSDEDDAREIRKKRTCILAIQSMMSLCLVELPFMIYRYACSQYYGIVMSSLFIKNVVSAVVDSIKLIVYFFGLNLSPQHLKEKGTYSKSCFYHFQTVLLRLLTLGSFIGEDFDADTDKVVRLCPDLCDCCDEMDEEDQEHGRPHLDHGNSYEDFDSIFGEEDVNDNLESEVDDPYHQ